MPQLHTASDHRVTMFAAAVLTDQFCEYCGVPNTLAWERMGNVLRWLGIEWQHDRVQATMRIHAREVPYPTVGYQCNCMSPGAVCLLGPLLVRFRQCNVEIPGSSVIGGIPLDIAVDGFRQLGADITLENGFFIGRCDRLVGTEVS